MASSFAASACAFAVLPSLVRDLPSSATAIRLAASGTTAGARPDSIQAFIPGASWEMLRTHCEEAHPEACRDVVGLGKAGVRELRRRLGLGMGVHP